MKIRDTVFGSQSECNIYEALKRQWKDFDIYSSLPFLNIIQIEEADVKAGKPNPKEWDFLKKTSIDYTLCEAVTHKPLLSIDFDGEGHGFSHFDSIGNPEYIQISPTKDRYRKLKFDLKLRLCYGLAYHYFVVSYDEAYPFENNAQLTILNGIIGYILSRKRFGELLYERKSDLEEEPYENYEEMKKFYERATGEEYTYNDYIQDWALELEVEADIDSDPIYREALALEGKLRTEGIQIKTRTFISLEEPPAPSPKDQFDVETIKKRVTALQNPSVKHGCEVSFETNTSLGVVKAKVFVRNIEWGLSSIISRNIAELLALRKIAKNLNLV